MKALFQALTTLALVSTSAQAAIDPDRLGVRQAPDLRFLNEALADTLRGSFLSARFKIANARSLTPLGRAGAGPSVKDILVRAELILKDTGLAPVTKAAMVADQLATAIPMVVDYYSGVRGQKGVPGAVLRIVALLDNLVPAARLDETLLGTADSLGYHAASLVESLGAGVPIPVGVALGEITDVLEDCELAPLEREREVSRRAQLVVDSVRRSRAFALAQ